MIYDDHIMFLISGACSARLRISALAGLDLDDADLQQDRLAQRAAVTKFSHRCQVLALPSTFSSSSVLWQVRNLLASHSIPPLNSQAFESKIGNKQQVKTTVLLCS